MKISNANRNLLPWLTAFIASTQVFVAIAGGGTAVVAVTEASTGFFSSRILCPGAVHRVRKDTPVGVVGSSTNRRGKISELTCTDGAGNKTVYMKEVALVGVGVCFLPLGVALLLSPLVFVVALRAARRKLAGTPPEGNLPGR